MIEAGLPRSLIGDRRYTPISVYGTSAIHPKRRVTWYMFRTDLEWESAKQSGLTSHRSWGF